MSKLKEAQQGYTFDDFVLSPIYSQVKSRKDPSILTSAYGFKYNIPIVSSPMNTVTETEMILAMCKLGGVGVIHRYNSIEEQVEIVKEVNMRLLDAGPNSMKYDDGTVPFYVAVGANGDFEKRVIALRGVGVAGFCVDVANGHNERSVQAVRAIRRLVPHACIMAGNVGTFSGALRLAEAGANSIRVGIGSGSVCTTREVTGHGIPQLTAIEDCVRIKTPQFIKVEHVGHDMENYEDVTKYTTSYPNVAIISDGGIRKSGDIIKALAIGADAVMLGSLLSGTQETPGEIIEEKGRLYKYYHGMASEEGRAQWSGQNTGVPAEGVSTKVPYTGKTAIKVIENLCDSVKVGLSFSGALTIEELQQKAIWCKVSTAGHIEGTPHGK